MKKQLLLILILVSFGFLYASAQTTGDYRSNAATFNWNTDASWERWNGTAWVVPTGAQGYPGETAASIAGTVTIRSGHTVTANVDVTTNDIGNLVLEGTGTITMSNNTDIDATGNLTMDGTSQILGTSSSRDLDVAGNFIVPITATNVRISGLDLDINGTTTVTGTLVLNNDNGVKNFKGKVTVTGSWTSTDIVTEGNLIFGAEVLTSGIFNPGCQDQ